MAGTSPVTPMLILTGVSFANRWYVTGQVDVKILVEGGIATALLALVAQIPGMGPVATGIAWIALVAVSITPAQNPSPAQTLLKITGS